MRINVHIERLVLDGLAVEQRQGLHVKAAVERELTRLLAEDRATPQFSTGRSLASIDGGSIQVAERADPGELGGQIAGAVRSGLGAGQ